MTGLYLYLCLCANKYKADLITAGSFLYIRKHLLAGKGENEKEDEIFILLIR